LKRTYDDWFSGLRPLAFGQVYSTLARLQRDDLAQVAHTEAGDGPERVVYELTPAGRERALGWLADPVEPGDSPVEDLLRKLLAAHRLDSDPDGLVGRQRTRHLRAMRALDPVEAGPARPGDPLARLASDLVEDHRRLHLDADLRWLALALERMHQQPVPPGPRPSVPPVDELRSESADESPSEQGARS
jgi:DNA-binding PadR family transcriptional regulator